MATCSNQEIHVNDIGTAFEVTLEDCGVIVDLSGAISITFTFSDPQGNNSAKVGALLTDGTDGKVVYTIQALDLDEAGIWKLQVTVELPTGTWNSNIEKFRVYPNL
jgi:hypothetical protein